MLLAGVILLFLGAAIWHLGRMGFAVGSHPFCRGCGFDLYMLPEDSARCPECGADILADDAIRVGHRRPVYWGMAAGAAGVLGGMVLLIAGGMIWWQSFDGSGFKTVGMLQHDAFHRDASTRGRACAELARRIDRGSIGAAQMQGLAQEIIKRQAGPNWEPRWGDLVQHGHLAKRADGGGRLLTQDLWREFLSQGMEISVRARPKVRSGDPIPIAVTCRLKVGTRWLPSGVTFAPAVVATSGGTTGGMGAEARACNYPVPLEWTVYWQPAAPLPPASRGVQLAVTVTACEGALRVPRAAVFTVPVEILDADGQSVTLHTPTARQREVFDTAFHWQLREAEDGTISLSEKDLGKIRVSGPPVTGAFRVVLRQGTGDARREWVIGRFVVQPGDAVTAPLAVPADGPAPGEAEIVCIPDATLAAGTVDAMEVWGADVSRRITLAP